MVKLVLEGVSPVETAPELPAGYWEDLKRICELQDELRAKVGKEKWDVVLPEPTPGLVEAVESGYGDKLRQANTIQEKSERGEAISAIR